MIEPYYDHDGITIYCADARDVVAQFADASVDFIFTDPPFGHNNNDGDLISNREAALGTLRAGEAKPATRPIANDGRVEADDLARWLFRESARVLVPDGCCCCCCGGGGPDPQFARWSMWMDEVLTFKQMVVWDKGPIGMGWHYRRSYETVLVGHRGPKCRWYDDTGSVENIIRNIPKVIPSAADHPTPKPEALVARFISLHTRPGDLVLDPFMGAGTTLRVAANLGRRAIGIEIDEHWAAAAVERLRQGVLL